MAVSPASLLPQELVDKRWIPVLVVGALSGAVAGAVAAYVALRPCPRLPPSDRAPSRHHQKPTPHIFSSKGSDYPAADQSTEQHRPSERPRQTQGPFSAHADADAIASGHATQEHLRSGKRMRPEDPSVEVLRGGGGGRDDGEALIDKLGTAACVRGAWEIGRAARGGGDGGGDGGVLGTLHSPLAPSGRRDPADPAPRSGSLSWDDYFMSLAFLSAERSKDPNKQVGAVIVNGENVILGIGYNGFPRGCCDSDLPWAKEARGPEGQPNPLGTKYPYVVHAEANALLNKNAASVAGARIYVTMFPCNECAKLLIQAGVREVVYHEDKMLHLESGGCRSRSLSPDSARGKSTAAAASPSSPPPPASARQQHRQRHLKALQAHQRAMQDQGEARSAGRGYSAAFPGAMLTPCSPLFDDDDDDDDETDMADVWSAVRRQKHNVRQLTRAGSASSASLASLVTPASAATTGAAVAGSPPIRVTVETAPEALFSASATSRDPLSAGAAAIAATAAAVFAAVSPDSGGGADASGAPWSGFWSHPRDSHAKGSAAATRGSASPPVSTAAAAPSPGPSSAQILSSWARAPSDSPSRSSHATEATLASSCSGFVAEQQVETKAGGGAVSGGGDRAGAAAATTALAAAVVGTDVCYMASFRLLRLAGVKLRQHKLQRVIVIPGPAARSTPGPVDAR